MSAEVLRQAASLMRERAEAATPGPWAVGPYHGLTSVLSADGGLTIASVGALRHPFVQADATHIASWHPAVALAVADWLDNEAHNGEQLNEVLVSCGDSPVNWEYGSLGKALAVARAYLGGEQREG